MSQPTLETDRLVLRPFRLSDSKEVQRLAGDPEVAKTTLNIPHPYPDGAAEAWIATHAKAWEERDIVTFAVELKQEARLIGCISLSFFPKHGRAELGYWIGKPWWNRGYGTEAAKKIIRFGVEDLKLRKITAHYMASNPASGRIMEKAGMQREGYLRSHFVRFDRAEDTVVYGLLADDAPTTPRSP